MITASDVSKIIDENEPRVDAFIEEVLVPKFVDQGRSVKISTRIAADYFNHEMSNKRFMDQMTKRGFHIKEDCDDRPAGSCWFEIQVPPQGE